MGEKEIRYNVKAINLWPLGSKCTLPLPALRGKDWTLGSIPSLQWTCQALSAEDTEGHYRRKGLSFLVPIHLCWLLHGPVTELPAVQTRGIYCCSLVTCPKQQAVSELPAPPQPRRHSPRPPDLDSAYPRPAPLRQWARSTAQIPPCIHASIHQSAPTWTLERCPLPASLKLPVIWRGFLFAWQVDNSVN